jgi:hypothetical protein
MAKYKAEHLQEMIRGVVREEVKSLLSGGMMHEIVASTISEVLSERYLRKLAESAVSARPRGVASLPIAGDDTPEEEFVPQPLANTILGVGQSNPAYEHEEEDEGVVQYQPQNEGKRNDILNMFFEGTRSITSVESEAGMEMPSADGILPAERFVEAPPRKATTAARRPMTEVWKQLAGVKDLPKGNVSEAIDPKILAEREEARLKRMRESLDVKVGG